MNGSLPVARRAGVPRDLTPPSSCQGLVDAHRHPLLLCATSAATRKRSWRPGPRPPLHGKRESTGWAKQAVKTCCPRLSDSGFDTEPARLIAAPREAAGGAADLSGSPSPSALAPRRPLGQRGSGDAAGRGAATRAQHPRRRASNTRGGLAGFRHTSPSCSGRTRVPAFNHPSGAGGGFLTGRAGLSGNCG